MKNEPSISLREDSLTAKKVINTLNELAPPSFSVLGDEEGLLLGDEDQPVNKVGVVWNLSPNILSLMAGDGVDFIITHTYPFLRRGVAKLDGYECLSDNALFTNKLKKKLLRQKGIALYRVHSSWDNAVGGNNDALAAALELRRVEKVAFGRVGSVKPLNLRAFSSFVKEKLGSPSLRFVGDPGAMVNRVMVAAGTGFLFPELIEHCYQEGVDVLVSGDLVKKAAKRALELGVFLIDAGALETEQPGMKALTNKLRERGFKAVLYESGGFYEYV
ncbi:hypothetical protein GF352_04225 [archaeon]|nr:hypothetical protein [archaeon]